MTSSNNTQLNENLAEAAQISVPHSKPVSQSLSSEGQCRAAEALTTNQISAFVLLFLLIVGLTFAGSIALRTTRPPLPSSPRYLVNINRASEADLVVLPEIGPQLAKQIIEFRHEHGPIQQLADLSNVPGIGAVTLEQIAPYLTVGERVNVDEAQNAQSMDSEIARNR